MLNPRQIEAFRTVIVTGGVTAAAQALHISQPAVTRLIHDLQYALGLKLFAKRGTRLVPTNEALSLYREVERQFVSPLFHDGSDRVDGVADDGGHIDSFLLEGDLIAVNAGDVEQVVD